MTKLVPPALRRASIHRARLDDRFEEISGHRLVLVEAAAGFGKTTLLASWHASCQAAGQHAAWLTLDATDQHAGQMIRYLQQAILGDTTAAGIEPHSSQPSRLAVASLVNFIAERRERQMIFLDDFHWADSPPTRALLAQLVSLSPPNLCFVIASRTRVELDRERWRLAGDLVEIGSDDLRLTAPEWQALCDANADIELDAAARLELFHRAEGWIAGLQLGLIARQSRGAAAPVVGPAGSVEPTIFNYFVANTPDAATDSSLICQRLAPLDCFSIDLARIVLQDENAAAALPRIAERNLFIEHLRGNRDWYRFHALFRVAALDALRRTEPEIEKQTLERAASWCAANGRTEEAIGYLMRLGRHEQAAELVLMSARWMTDVGHLAQQVAWVQSLPAEVTRGEPLFALLQAWSLFHMRRAADAEVALEHCIAASTANARQAHGLDTAQLVPVIRAGLTVTRGDFAGARRLAETTLSTRALEPFAAGTLRNILGYACYQLGDMSAAREHLEEAAKLHRGCGCWGGVIYALCLRGMVDLADADLVSADRMVTNARQLAMQRCGSRSTATAMASVLYHVIRVERGEALKDREALELVLREVETCGHPEVLALGAVALAHVLLAEGLGTRAASLLQRVGVVFRDEGTTGLHDVSAAERARVLLRMNQADEAAAIATQLAHAPMLQLLLQAEIALFRGKRDVAVRILESARGAYFKTLPGRLRLELECLETRATASNEQWQTYCRQLRMNGWVRMASMPLGRGDDSGVLTALGTDSSPLSDRELAVLRLMSEGRTNPMIADVLGISLNTVKYHINNVFQKLHVTNRTSAVMVAVERGLIDS